MLAFNVNQANRLLVSLGGDVATAGRAPDGGWRILMSEDSRADADGPGEDVAIAPLRIRIEPQGRRLERRAREAPQPP